MQYKNKYSNISHKHLQYRALFSMLWKCFWLNLMVENSRTLKVPESPWKLAQTKRDESLFYPPLYLRAPPLALLPLSLLITLDYSWSCLVRETFDSKNKAPLAHVERKRGKRETKHSPDINLHENEPECSALWEKARARKKERGGLKEDLPRVRWYN